MLSRQTLSQCHSARRSTVQCTPQPSSWEPRKAPSVIGSGSVLFVFVLGTVTLIRNTVTAISVDDLHSKYLLLTCTRVCLTGRLKSVLEAAGRSVGKSASSMRMPFAREIVGYEMQTTSQPRLADALRVARRRALGHGGVGPFCAPSLIACGSRSLDARCRRRGSPCTCGAPQPASAMTVRNWTALPSPFSTRPAAQLESEPAFRC